MMKRSTFQGIAYARDVTIQEKKIKYYLLFLYIYQLKHLNMGGFLVLLENYLGHFMNMHVTQ